ncbi:carbohydrate-binding module family 13 protein [Trichosporon asahii var. asahii CBS 2479]|uniref:Carbohydrate-binding module family 13 protein n=1 Tax=Trichosporon asahii var. asahii (strain ATCC 90039 / CBS 2479 / JCM 2466 / KCTC 7840 / NBRC 103889/ NCYC 2677 / UAMH 7654) TaxID=1186058 RepID=J4U626_TRIAS|nr:carbohydrate-binding module family 13 protein [Trichosporon asahii var. asahii CBS 2479]EJT45500.1 carbohydrate-binding module family 13 protein [Trichosporon asahii var. asahii CBS 2479]
MFTNLLLALVTAVPALADNQIKPKNTDSDLCIDNTNGVLIDGNPLQVWTCYRGNTNQGWAFNQDPAAPTQFKMGTTGRCIGVAWPTSGNLLDAPVVLAPCTGPGYRTWFYRTGDYMCILGTNYCVQLDEECPDDGTNLKIALKTTPPALQFFDYTTPAN